MSRHIQERTARRHPQPLFLCFIGLTFLGLLTACLASGQSRSRLLDDPRGEASYYGSRFAGETTANGETFDPDDLTAAHPSLPFDTVVRVTRIGGERRRAVTVRINDRGPYADDRIIDLSRAAAEEIGMIEDGIVEVRIEVVEVPEGGKTASTRQSSSGW